MVHLVRLLEMGLGVKAPVCARLYETSELRLRPDEPQRRPRSVNGRAGDYGCHRVALDKVDEVCVLARCSQDPFGEPWSKSSTRA